jgi:cytochrome c
MGMHRELRGLVAGSAMAMLVCTGARAQNLDQGKSAQQLFANGCSACHHSPRGLAKGRIKLQLFMFLKDHYVTNSSEAWALAAYLQSTEGPARGRSRTGAAKPSHAPRHNDDSKTRPPMQAQ